MRWTRIAAASRRSLQFSEEARRVTVRYLAHRAGIPQPVWTNGTMAAA